MAINDLESLHNHLQWALELEHATIPPYLCALYSIKEGHNQEAVEVLQSVFLEEMLHMALVANVLNAVGGKPQVDKPEFMPTYPTYLPHSNRAFQVPLLKFSPEALEVFLNIERPGDHDAPPEDDNFETIGQFYEGIEQALRRLADEMGEAVLFAGDPARQIQIDTTYYGGGGSIIPVTDLKSALAALEEVIEQGEGLQHQSIWDGDRNMFHPEREEVAHYFRFQEVQIGRNFQQGDTAQSGPTGDTFDVDWDAVHNMHPNPRTQDFRPGSLIHTKLVDFNQTYTNMLRLLHQCFNGQPALLGNAVGTMYEIKIKAVELMQLPSGDGKTTVGPSFEYVTEEKAQTSAVRKIVVRPNGPYIAYGKIPLVRKTKITSEENEPLSWRTDETIETQDSYALCRCGASSTKPFCDGTHARIDFDGTETAATNTIAERQEIFEGEGITIKRDGSLCMHAGFCANRITGVRKMVPESGDIQVRSQLIAMSERCPSGTYSYSLGPDGADIEPDLPQEISVIDEGVVAGPLWVSGGIPIERADGEPVETRNRMTLCRCGHSNNKPFCDGVHHEIGFVG